MMTARFRLHLVTKKYRNLAPNYAFTPDDGWNFLVRAYRPDVEAFSDDQMPAFKAVE